MRRHADGRGPTAKRDRHRWAAPFRTPLTTVAATAAFGVVMLVLPAVGISTPGLATRLNVILTTVGLLLVGAGVATQSPRWRWAGTLAAVAAILLSVLASAQATARRAGPVPLAVEGLLILGYLTALDMPRTAAAPMIGRWLRQQVPLLAWGGAATGVTLITLGIGVPVSAWLVVAGIAAVVAATAIALPRRRRAVAHRSRTP